MRFAACILTMALVIGFAGWKLCFPGNQSLTATPALESQWTLEVYNLDDDEVVRFIPPLYPLQRATSWWPGGQLSGQTMHLVRSDGYVNAMQWTGKTGTVRSAFAHCVDIPAAELRVQPKAGSVVVDGDWIVREQTSKERRMQALGQLLDSATGGKIEVKSNSIPSYCVVVQGRWNSPERNGEEPKPLRFGQKAPQDASTVVRSGSPQDFLRILEQNCRCRFIDETVDARKIEQEITSWWPISPGFGEQKVDPPATISWMDDVPPGVWDAFERRNIFRTLESQTSLQFIETRRAIPIWNVQERSASTQPMKAQ
jgi:hypothetical protein